ncbi:16S rRNA (adenine(1518)-N(6)/adenine(1519)-N(6))-dimethyltransferase [Endozoicomonas sp. OPT23]|uniref:16S rRNA (adenine(1518)-N(6)/adenine(1519)-N(6))- dimethyltransferase RsmA n=1 Tax=Endozoicomonas sp. OPT23 TaxID=2072845 RepID=UPI00129A47AA|nr:16S rRNA (adenine(1518)-N(6)/adenine(1519)-N(6))-dimethyltransferase RsmA [Endozoicomonas sp. OPT23]MRI33698.1 16S rRNA (adenine(1518)-N(6)/adenine(1519)-N(6))-dimethyltransferase [Endozoicomonas sp. OPT23]
MTDIPFHKARKRFGQNFLHDHGVIQRIIRSIHPKEGDNLVEIGPGQGAITEYLLDNAGELDVIELDKDLIPTLKLRFGLNPGFRIHQGDALKFDFTSLQKNEEPLRLVGNLPYNISTPLIFHLLQFQGLISDMHFMLQKEVVERLAAQAGDKHYGRLGIMAQYYCRVDYLFIVNPGCFSPAPKVDSAIVRLTPYTDLPYPCKNVELLERVVREAFQQRRKTMRNTLKKLISAEEMEALSIDPTSRPERITLEQFVSIADYLNDKS